ncbi:hypothetical protein [endosymbiont GvMRE of Glomus versiforme]|uniref:hypothetical protein n=1 Tax=endosymbiont GvMRE of Glomus versiforme TaxID=2039283 RepID=UPI0011C42D0B|nr:hypothetical protein [endosymbiont GvMRE of Glomus versiforme]
MNKNNLEQQNDYEFCRNLHLEEQGFSPCPLVGYINSWKKIPFEDGKRFLYEFFIEDEVLGKGYSHYFWAKNFYPYEDEEWLKKILKPGTEIKAHGDYVKVGGTRIKGLKSNWEQWWKKIT